MSSTVKSTAGTRAPSRLLKVLSATTVATVAAAAGVLLFGQSAAHADAVALTGVKCGINYTVLQYGGPYPAHNSADSTELTTDADQGGTPAHVGGSGSVHLNLSVTPNPSPNSGNLTVTVSSSDWQFYNGPAAGAAAGVEELDAVINVGTNQYLVRGPANTTDNAANGLLFDAGWTITGTVPAPTTASTYTVNVGSVIVNAIDTTQSGITTGIGDNFDEICNLSGTFGTSGPPGVPNGGMTVAVAGTEGPFTATNTTLIVTADTSSPSPSDSTSPSTSPSDSTSPSTSPSDSTSPSTSPSASTSPSTSPSDSTSPSTSTSASPTPTTGSQLPSTVTKQVSGVYCQIFTGQDGTLWNGPPTSGGDTVAAPKFTVALTPQNPAPGAKVTITVSYDVGNGAGPIDIPANSDKLRGVIQLSGSLTNQVIVSSATLPAFPGSATDTNSRVPSIPMTGTFTFPKTDGAVVYASLLTTADDDGNPANVGNTNAMPTKGDTFNWPKVSDLYDVVCNKSKQAKLNPLTPTSGLTDAAKVAPLAAIAPGTDPVNAISVTAGVPYLGTVTTAPATATTETAPTVDANGDTLPHTGASGTLAAGLMAAAAIQLGLILVVRTQRAAPVRRRGSHA